MQILIMYGVLTTLLIYRTIPTLQPYLEGTLLTSHEIGLALKLLHTAPNTF